MTLPPVASLMLLGCWGPEHQQLTAADDGTLRNLGKCVELPPGQTAAGTLARISACTATDNQRWTVNSARQLVNSPSGRCLTVPGGQTSSAVQLAVADCDPADIYQRWLAPRKPAVTTTASAYNAADQLTATVSGSTTTAFGYDANGNLTAAGAVTSTFDLANRTATTTTGATTTSYSYDGAGKRLTTSTNGTVDTRFTWDPNNPLAMLTGETDSAGASIRPYVNGIDGPLSMTSGSATSYYHRDAYGSISDGTSAAGAPQWSHAYEAFGAPRATNKLDVAAAANPMQYTGQYQDPGGMYHLRARQYDPQVGRFTATDPLAPQIDDPYVSAYVYVDGRPTAFDDDSGLSKCGLGWDVIGNGVDCIASVTRPARESRLAHCASHPLNCAENMSYQAEALQNGDLYGKRVTPGQSSTIHNRPWAPAFDCADPIVAAMLAEFTGALFVPTRMSQLRPSQRAIADIGARGAAKGVRVFSSADAHVASAANAVEAALPGRVVGVNTQRAMSNGLRREVDIDLGNVIVQVKSGNARSLTGQILRTQASTGTRTVGYAPDISDTAWSNAARQGIPILRTHDELLAYLREFG